jgi:hypothetical protein
MLALAVLVMVPLLASGVALRRRDPRFAGRP